MNQTFRIIKCQIRTFNDLLSLQLLNGIRLNKHSKKVLFLTKYLSLLWSVKFLKIDFKSAIFHFTKMNYTSSLKEGIVFVCNWSQYMMKYERKYAYMINYCHFVPATNFDSFWQRIPFFCRTWLSLFYRWL